MHLVDEEDAVPGALQLFDHLLQPLFELATVLRTRDQRADVQRDDPLVEQHLRHFAARDPLRQRLDDRCLADARLTDEHGVVLGAAREDLDDALDLLFAADHRVELVRACCRRQVDAQLVNGRRAGGGSAALGGALRHALRQDARHFGAHLVEAYAEAFQHAGSDALALADETQQQVLGADVVVAETARLIDGQLDHLLRAWCKADLAHDRAVATADDELDCGADFVQFDAEVGEHLRGNAFTLSHQAEQQVLGADVVVVEAQGFFLSESEDATRPLGKLVEPVRHKSDSPSTY